MYYWQQCYIATGENRMLFEMDKTAFKDKVIAVKKKGDKTKPGFVTPGTVQILYTRIICFVIIVGSAVCIIKEKI
jgi:hypothetical protein